MHSFEFLQWHNFHNHIVLRDSNKIFKKGWENKFSQVKSTVIVISYIHFKLESSKESKDQDSCILASRLLCANNIEQMTVENIFILTLLFPKEICY